MAGTGAVATSATTEVTVFVDDAVRGRFPPVCARQGTPSEGRLTIRTTIGGSTGLPTAVWVVLALLGPGGWLALALLSFLVPDRSEVLSVEVPWTVAAEEQARALRHRRFSAWVLTTAGVVALAATGIASAGDGPWVTTFMAQALATVVAAGTLVAVATAIATSWQLRRVAVRVELDASRRWVTLGNVHPAFARAVRDTRAATTPDQPRDAVPGQ